LVDPLILTPQRPSPSPSSNLAGILSNSQMGPRISPSPRIGTSLSIITARKPCRLVRPPRWPHHTATTRISVLRLIHSTRRNWGKRSSDHTAPAALSLHTAPSVLSLHTAPAVLSLHMAAGPTPDTRPSSPIRTFPQPLLACRSSRCTTSPIYTTTPCHSNSSSSSKSIIRHRVWKNTTACLSYSVAHSRLRAQC
jgi:hypothetical protein